MSIFTAYYWLQQSDKKHALCQEIEADSMDAATEVVKEQMKTPVFAFDSESHGRVVIASAHVQYVELEYGSIAEDTSVIDLLEVSAVGR